MLRTGMPQIGLFVFSLLLSACGDAGPAASDEALNGRWVIDVTNVSSARPMWLEVNNAGTGTPEGVLIGAAAGRTQPFLEAEVRGGELRFRVERELDDGRRISATTSARVVDGELRGTTIRGKQQIEWVGRRASEIADKDDGHWREEAPVVLFDDTDLAGWHTWRPGRESEWSVEDGVLRNSDGADLLVSNDTFWNFKLHVEYRVAPGSNSGIGLRGRYEIQILDDHGKPASIHGNGALYSRIKPAVNASKPADEWQTFEMTLIGRDLTVMLNGETLIDRNAVEGLTAMAIDSQETEPGPIVLQGDHGPVKFRRIVVTPLASGS